MFDEICLRSTNIDILIVDKTHLAFSYDKNFVGQKNQNLFLKFDLYGINIGFDIKGRRSFDFTFHTADIAPGSGVYLAVQHIVFLKYLPFLIAFG